MGDYIIYTCKLFKVGSASHGNVSVWFGIWDGGKGVGIMLKGYSWCRIHNLGEICVWVIGQLAHWELIRSYQAGGTVRGNRPLLWDQSQSNICIHVYGFILNIYLLYLKGILTNQIAPFPWYIKWYPARPAGPISLRYMISDRPLVDLHFARW